MSPKRVSKGAKPKAAAAAPRAKARKSPVVVTTMQTGTPPANPEIIQNPAYGVVEPLSVFVRWSRLRFYERIADDVGVTIDRSAITILDMLYRHGPIRMSELARRIGLDRSTVSRQVAAVVDSGLVEKVDDTTDARAALLSLSPQGQGIRQKLAHAWHSIAMNLVADWQYDDQVHFARLLTKLAQRLQADSGG